MFRSLLLVVFLCLVITVSRAAPIKVACIGDSITEGAGLSSPGVEGYPAKLQRLLGPAYQVSNFGVSGRTLLKKGDYPYWKESAYSRSLAFKPDIVFILLGTNDSKPQNWRHSTNFMADFEELIASYASLETRPRMVLGTPPPVFKNGAFDIRPAVVADEIAPLVRQLAAEPGRELVDFHTRLAGRTEWFPDTVHPDSRGTSPMAAILWETIVGPASEEEPELRLDPVASNRAALEWPRTGAGFVVTMSPALSGPQAKWVVSPTPIYNNGDVLRQTNSPSNVRYYRLLRP
ncbi:MAG TPA: GDSL-type esterase/lipase family protein [Verrucomicrobiota bacterium]|nr:GDSL-type esterase/lipase family protein [Verrucomicrobiota bacterium]